MSRLENKLVLITGASAGIGEACAHRFAREGARLALWARRLDRLDRIAEHMETQHGAAAHVARVDVRDRDAVFEAARALEEEVGVPDVLVNNAGLAGGFDPFQSSDPEDWDVMIDTNLKGLLSVTRAVLPGMIEAGRGHVINIGSTAGHMVYPRGHVYAATKHAVKALTQAINLDVTGTPVRISSVDPGMVETEFSRVRFHGDDERAAKVYEGFEPLTADDVADAVHYVASLPERVNIRHLILVPTAQRNVFVVDRSG